MTDHSDLRRHIEAYFDQAAWAKASRALATYWQQEGTHASAAYVISRYERLRAYLPLTSCKLAILRSFTVEPVVPLVRALAFVSGIDLTVQVGDFNAYAQEILDPTSRLYRFEPEIVILAIQTRDVASDLWECYTDLSAMEREAVVKRVIDSFRSLVQVFRSRSGAHLVVHNLEIPSSPSQGVLDNQSATGQVAAIQRINQELRHLASNQTGVYVLDYDALVGRHGRMRWYDARNWFTVRMPIAAQGLIYLAKEWLRFVHPLNGKGCKVLVTDLDNTLWGGVIGEETIETLQLGPEPPGVAYQALQRAMLDLYNRGIILALCSKNNLHDAMDVIENHPGMLLRPHHFAALRINWNDKVQNLREIAAELNVSMDALAFLDDNPVERAEVCAELPEVSVIELSDAPMSYAQALRDSPVFERLTLSTEDRERGRYYVERHQRLELERSVASLEEFYCALQQEIDIEPVTAKTIARVAQLTQKTNQFNLTTRRYTEQQIAALCARRDWRLYSLRVRDRFGDNGLVGMAIMHFAGDVCEIDTFLLSCRVIGRTVETAFLAFLVEDARIRGVRHLRGWFFPTRRNSPAKDFYANHGFDAVEQQGPNILWTLDLKDSSVACPEWIITHTEKSLD